MKLFLSLFILPGLLLAACSGAHVPDPDAPGRESATTAPTIRPIITATPTPVGTWKTVIDGLVYEGQTESRKPITGATIRFDVLHSHFAGLQEGRPNQTVTDELGQFTLPVIVHDTDSIRLLVEARGYISYEERLVGVDLFGGKSFNIGLTSLQTGTATPP